MPIDRFVSAGYPREYLLAVDLVPNDGDNVRAAERFIARGVEELLAAQADLMDAQDCSDRPIAKVDLVAHSMGAISSRWYASFVSPERVRRLITLAGANHGTNELCGHSGDGNRQMCPAFSEATGENEVQFRLNGTNRTPVDETPYGAGIDRPTVRSIPPDAKRRIAYLTVRLTEDEWIDPADSAVLDGADDLDPEVGRGFPVMQTHPGNLLFLAPTRHDDLPMHPDLIRLVAGILSAPD